MYTRHWMTLQTIGSYASKLRPELSADAFEPARSRLLWIPVHVGIIVLAATAIARGWVAWPFAFLLSLVIGGSFGGLTFLAHETLHGGVVRGKRLRHLVGWIGFCHFFVSPTLWIAWHNKVHHGNAGSKTGADPDAYPMLAQYQNSRAVRIVTDTFSLGADHRWGVLSLFFGFTGQSGQVLVTARKLLGMSASEHRRVIAEVVLAVVLWGTVAVVVGPLAFLFIYGIPLVVANAVVMAFILTNHSLSPRTEINDPLANSLSVTTPPLVEWLTLRFGYHVEHHLFPAMSSRHAPQVRDLIRAHWPERYQSMPLTDALIAMTRTGRVYKDDTTLIDPLTGHESPTLAAGVASALPAPIRPRVASPRGKPAAASLSFDLHE